MRLRVDVILAQGAAVALIPSLRLPVPVVYVFSGDPVSAGFADSLAHPRGNMTGLTFMAAELNGKRLELLREIVPNLHRVAILANPAHPGEHLERDYTQEYGRQLGLVTDYFATTTREETRRMKSAIEIVMSFVDVPNKHSGSAGHRLPPKHLSWSECAPFQ